MTTNTANENSEQYQELDAQQVLENEDELSVTMERIERTGIQLVGTMESMQSSWELISNMETISDAELEVVKVQIQGSNPFMSADDRNERDAVMGEMSVSHAPNREIALEGLMSSMRKAFPLLDLLIKLLERFKTFMIAKMKEFYNSRALARIEASVKSIRDFLGVEVMNRPIGEMLQPDYSAQYKILQTSIKNLRISPNVYSLNSGVFDSIPVNLEQLCIVSRKASDTVRTTLEDMERVVKRMFGVNDQYEDMSIEIGYLERGVFRAYEEILAGAHMKLGRVKDEDDFTRESMGVPGEAGFFQVYPNSSGVAIWKDGDYLRSVQMIYAQEPEKEVRISLSVKNIGEMQSRFKSKDIMGRISDLQKEIEKRVKYAQEANRILAPMMEKLEARDLARDKKVDATTSDNRKAVARIKAILTRLLSYVRCVENLTAISVNQIMFALDFMEASTRLMKTVFAAQAKTQSD